MTHEAILEKLLEGNRRFVTGMPRRPNQSVRRRKELGDGQKPLAVIIGCSDSRVVPEFLFDQGLGDLFVVRVAGQVADDAELASVEYAVTHLDVSLVIVLGHSNCGAVGATVTGGEAPGHMGVLVKAIQPAIKPDTRGNVDQCARKNVQLEVEQLARSEPIIGPAFNAGSLKVVGAFYDIVSGKVELL
jgi:carbonic anhydrase